MGVISTTCAVLGIGVQYGEVSFEQEEGKVSIHWVVKGQGINNPIPFTLYYQGEGVLPLTR